jgi:hypothetical protein
MQAQVEALYGRDPERSRRGEPAAEILSEAKDVAGGAVARYLLAGYLPAEGSALLAVSTSTCTFSAGSASGG